MEFNKINLTIKNRCASLIRCVFVAKNINNDKRRNKTKTDS
jgi:hypothetical protein